MSNQITPQNQSSSRQPETVKIFNGPLSQYGLPSWLVYILGVIGAIYLLNPTAGILELIPDLTPFVGNLDEGLAMMLILTGVAEAKSARKNRKAQKAAQAAQNIPPSQDSAM